MKIELHIERLVLDGVLSDAGHGKRIGAAVTRELERLFRAGGLDAHLAGGGAMPSLAAPQIRIAPRERPEAVGRKIAGAVHASTANTRGGRP